MHRKFQTIALVFVLLAAGGCTGGGSLQFWTPPPPAEPPPPRLSTLSVFDMYETSDVRLEFTGPVAQFKRCPDGSATFTGSKTITFSSVGWGDYIGIDLRDTLDNPTLTYQFFHYDRVDRVGGLYDVFQDSPPDSDAVRRVTLTNMQRGGLGLDYTSYGIFEKNTLHPIYIYRADLYAAAFAVGFLTPSSDIPADGTASYSGRMDGRYSDGQTANKIVTGEMSLMADFGAATVSGDFTNVVVDGAEFRNIGIDAAISGNAFSGSVETLTAARGQSGPDMSGTVNGNFYGPAADEISGVFQLTGDDVLMVGGFAGK